MVGASGLMLLLTVVGVYALMQKKRAKKATDQNNPFGKKRFSVTKDSSLTNSFSFICSHVGCECEHYRCSAPNGSKSFQFQRVDELYRELLRGKHCWRWRFWKGIHLCNALSSLYKLNYDHKLLVKPVVLPTREIIMIKRA